MTHCSATIKSVLLSLVTSRIKDPFLGRSFPLVHFAKVLKIKKYNGNCHLERIFEQFS